MKALKNKNQSLQNSIFSSLLISAFFFAVIANAQTESNGSEAQARGPASLTSEQRSCLESKLGKPGVGERPSREKAEAAFTACNVDVSSMGRGHDDHHDEGRGDRRGPPPGFENLTSTQKNCLKGILGEPGSGERPSREKMESAMTQCQVQLPSREARNEDGAYARRGNQRQSGGSQQ